MNREGTEKGQRKTASKAVPAKIAAVLLAIAAAAVGACNNFFHELIPPDGDRITFFSVLGQTGIEMGENTISVTVAKGTDIESLIPSIQVSSGAKVFPGTPDYLEATFPGSGPETVNEIINSGNLPSYVRDLIRQNPGFTVPELTLPVREFKYSEYLPVVFFVVSGQGSIRQYDVTVTEENDDPQLLGLRFAKYDNPELIKDAVGIIGGGDIFAEALYPVEMPELSHELVMSFEILGEKLEIEVDGEWKQIHSGEAADRIKFGLGMHFKTLRVTRGGASRDFNLTLTAKEDPDTLRSITDFRFEVQDNPSVLATSVASIINSGDYGTVNLRVFYTGGGTNLVPRFISPGTVRVNGSVQTSGSTGQDFGAPLQYEVVSKNLLYRRVYTVNAELVLLADPVMLSFDLHPSLNDGLVRESHGVIGSANIAIDVNYGGTVEPRVLVPTFKADGIVTVLNSVQVSGSSSQDFTGRIKYKVTHPVEDWLFHEYVVDTRLIPDQNSAAVITDFSFDPAENPRLTEALTGIIEQDGIAVFVPPGSKLTDAPIIPRLSAVGKVSVNGAAQTSGSSPVDFSSPVIYTVVSANGAHSREYTVTVQELTSPLYVKAGSARSRREGRYWIGTGWDNAFSSLEDATLVASQFPDDIPREIWIAAGTYYTNSSGSSFTVTPNTSFLGGFDGTETDKNQRREGTASPVLSGNFAGNAADRNLRFERLEIRDGNFDAAKAAEVVFDRVGFSNIPKTVKIAGSGNMVFDSVEFDVPRLAVSSKGNMVWNTSRFRVYNQDPMDWNDPDLINNYYKLNASITGNLTVNACSFADIMVANITIGQNASVQANTAADASVSFNATGDMSVNNWKSTGTLGSSFSGSRSLTASVITAGSASFTSSKGKATVRDVQTSNSISINGAFVDAQRLAGGWVSLYCNSTTGTIEAHDITGSTGGISVRGPWSDDGNRPKAILSRLRANESSENYDPPYSQGNTTYINSGQGPLDISGIDVDASDVELGNMGDGTGQSCMGGFTISNSKVDFDGLVTNGFRGQAMPFHIGNGSSVTLRNSTINNTGSSWGIAVGGSGSNEIYLYDTDFVNVRGNLVGKFGSYAWLNLRAAENVTVNGDKYGTREFAVAEAETGKQVMPAPR